MNIGQSLLAAGALLVSTFGASMAQPVGYPSRPVNVIVAFPPGAPNDFIVRLIGEPFNAAMKQPLIADNRPGRAAISPPKSWRARLQTAIPCWPRSTPW